LTGPYTGGNSAHYGGTSSSTIGSKGTGVSLFANPTAAYNLFRYALPTDTSAGGGGVIRNLPAWNLDMTVTKDLTIRERFGMMFIFQSTNVLNHVLLGAPNFALGSPTTFGVITSSATSYNPRQMEFGLRFHF